jgi:hypothetical protein
MALVLLEVNGEPKAPDWCFEMNDHLELPTCTWDGTQWHRSYESDAGLPGAFGAIFVLMLLVGVALFAWRISLARRVARDTGMDPNRATELTILGDNGLEAGFLAGHLRQRPADQQPAAPAVRSAEVRLRELADLRDQGLVTHEEYDARRKAIVDAL